MCVSVLYTDISLLLFSQYAIISRALTRAHTRAHSVKVSSQGTEAAAEAGQRNKYTLNW